jgi:N4-gp56 family major capsid protein
MAGITDTASTGISNSLQAYFSKELLKQIVQNIVLEQFAKKQALPEKAGKNSVRFFRYVEPETSNIKGLTEGDGHSSGTAWAKGAYKEMTLEYVDVTLSQYGQVIGISDLLTAQELFNHLEQATTVNGQDAALHLDTKIAYTLGDDTSITGGTTITSNKISRFAGASAYYAAAPTSSQVMTGLELLDTATALKVNNAPATNGYYTAVADPRVLRDLQNDSDWISSRHYGDPDAIMKGEVGRYAGIRCIETTNAYQTEHGAYSGGTIAKRVTYNGSGGVYSTFVFGDQAFGTVDLASQSPYAPKMQIAQGADKTDPLAQLTTVGFKTYYGQKILQPKFLAQVYSGTNYS